MCSLTVNSHKVIVLEAKNTIKFLSTIEHLTLHAKTRVCKFLQHVQYANVRSLPEGLYHNARLCYAV